MPRILGNWKTLDRVRKILPFVIILTHTNSLRIFPSNFLKIHVNISLPSTLKHSKRSFSLRLLVRILHMYLLSPYASQDTFIPFLLIGTQ